MKSKTPIRILFADQTRFLAEAFELLLTREPDLQMIGHATDGLDAMEMVRKLEPDVLVLDPNLPRKQGLDLVKQIISLRNRTQVLILSPVASLHQSFRMLRAGSRGWIPKTCKAKELLKAIRAVADGKVFLVPEVQKRFAERYLRPEDEMPPAERLSDREFQVMCLLASGKTNREIADLLFISVKTVDTHRANLLKKLELRNNADIARFALSQGHIEWEP